MPLPPPEFEEGVAWDGTTPHSRPNTDIFKSADGEIGNRLSSEIIALEELLKNVVSTIEILENPGAANSILGVTNDQSNLEYKTLTQGTGIVITHAVGSVTISSTGGGFDSVAGESVSVGDAVYIASTGKAMKALANAENTSRVIGFSDRNAIIDEAIVVITGIMNNSGWSLTIGNLYYLSPTVAGAITNTAPTTTGQLVIPVGVANASDVLVIDIQTRVKL
jgi:hypothetical protein